MESASSFTIQTEVLCKGLRYAELETLVDEIADCPSILTQAAGSEALVCTVKEREVCPCSDSLSDLLPLSLRRVDTGWIVCTGMEEDNAAFGGRLDRIEHASKIETLSADAEVGICFDRETDICEDLIVICPCWGGKVYRR